MQLSDVIQAYLTDRRHKGMAANTLRNESRVLRQFLAAVGNVETRSLRPQHIDAFWASRVNWSVGTRNIGRGVLGKFFAWCQARRHIAKDIDLLDGARSQRVPPRDRVIIPQSEFQTFLDGVGDPRTRIAVAIGLYLFLRISEIQALRVQDVNLDSKTIEVYRTKTTTLDTLPICSELEREIKRWKLIYASKVGQTLVPGWFLIPGLPRGGNQFGTKGMKGFTGKVDAEYHPTKLSNLAWPMRHALTNAGYYRPMEGGHTLRRSGAIALYNQLSHVGHDRAIRICQAMLGHASIRTTEIYLRLDLDRKVRNDLLAGKQMFPDTGEADVIALKGPIDGKADARVVRV